MANELVTAAASVVPPAVRIGGMSSYSYERYPLAAVVAAGGTPWPVRSITLNIFPQGWEGSKTPFLCTRGIFRPRDSCPHESPRPSQRVAIYLQFERYDEEVDSRGAGVHLLLVATKFRCSCSPPRGRHNLPRCSQSFTKCRVVRLAAMSISTSADNAYCPLG